MPSKKVPFPHTSFSYGQDRPSSGRDYYVDSGNTIASDDNLGDSPERPLATIDAALISSRVDANNGDTIYVMPGHAETVTADAGIAMDIAGVSIVGMGQGNSRPVVTFATNTTANLSVTAANCRVKGIVFRSNLATLVSMVEIAADSFEISECEFSESTLSALLCIKVGLANADADDTWIHDNVFYWNEPGATNTGDSAISIDFDSDRIMIEDNHIVGDFDLAAINVLVGGNECDFLTIRNNYIESQAAGIHAIQINTAGTMNSLLVHDNILIADVPSTTAQLHTAKQWNNILPLGNVSGPRDFWVDSNGGGADAGEGTKDSPYLTIDFAIAQVTASHGDIINVAAGHAETVSADSGIDVDQIGVTIQGHGVGDDRPILTYASDANADMKLAAASAKIDNIVFRANVTELTMFIEVTADDCEISNCVFQEGTASFQNGIAIVGNGTGDRTYIHHNRFLMDEPGATNTGDAAISIDGDVDNVRIEDNWMVGDWDEAGILVSSLGDNSDFLTIARNYVESTVSGIPCIDITTAGTMIGGNILDNRLVAPTSAAMLRPDTLHCLGNIGSLGLAGQGDFPVPGFLVGERGARVTVHTATFTEPTHQIGAVAVFTVTGEVMARCYGFVTTILESDTCNTGTLALGVEDNTAVLLPQVIVDETNFSANDVWGEATTTVQADKLFNEQEYVFIGGGEDIELIIATEDMTGGVLEISCEWYPVSIDGDVIAV